MFYNPALLIIGMTWQNISTF